LRTDIGAPQAFYNIISGENPVPTIPASLSVGVGEPSATTCLENDGQIVVAQKVAKETCDQSLSLLLLLRFFLSSSIFLVVLLDLKRGSVRSKANSESVNNCVKRVSVTSKVVGSSSF